MSSYQLLEASVFTRILSTLRILIKSYRKCSMKLFLNLLLLRRHTTLLSFKVHLETLSKLRQRLVIRDSHQEIGMWLLLKTLAVSKLSKQMSALKRSVHKKTQPLITTNRRLTEILTTTMKETTIILVLFHLSEKLLPMMLVKKLLLNSLEMLLCLSNKLSKKKGPSKKCQNKWKKTKDSNKIRKLLTIVLNNKSLTLTRNFTNKSQIKNVDAVKLLNTCSNSTNKLAKFTILLLDIQAMLMLLII